MTPDEHEAPTLREIPAADFYYADDEPPCLCEPPTPWVERKYDGTWDAESIEQRTCLKCDASLSRSLT
jgi:hypothetical protein